MACPGEGAGTGRGKGAVAMKQPISFEIAEFLPIFEAAALLEPRLLLLE